MRSSDSVQARSTSGLVYCAKITRIERGRGLPRPSGNYQKLNPVWATRFPARRARGTPTRSRALCGTVKQDASLEGRRLPRPFCNFGYQTGDDAGYRIPTLIPVFLGRTRFTASFNSKIRGDNKHEKWAQTGGRGFPRVGQFAPPWA